MSDSNRILISVIVPCYNIGDYLDSCLQSIAAQKTEAAEFIFINDGSKDNTLEKLQEFCKTDAKYVLINQENQGVSAARNNAIKVAKGEYIYLLDGDDILAPGAVDRMVGYLQEYSPDVIISDTIKRHGNDEVLVKSGLTVGVYSPEEIYDRVRVFPTPPKIIYRLKILANQNIFFNQDLKLGEVYDFTIRVLSNSEKVVVVSDVFFYYIMRDSSATHKPNYSRDLTVLDTLLQYDNEGVRFKEYDSFKITALKMALSFTYNKYLKLGLTDNGTFSAVEVVLKNPILQKYLSAVIKSSKLPIKERLLYSYIALTGLNGYKLLSK